MLWLLDSFVNAVLTAGKTSACGVLTDITQILTLMQERERWYFCNTCHDETHTKLMVVSRSRWAFCCSAAVLNPTELNSCSVSQP